MKLVLMLENRVNLTLTENGWSTNGMDQAYKDDEVKVPTFACQ